LHTGSVCNWEAMILQTDSRLNAQINASGCYWMSLLWWGNKLAGREYDPDEIELLYKWHVDSDWMRPNLYIQRPDEILRDVGVTMPGWLGEVATEWQPPDGKRGIEILYFEMPRTPAGVWGHFVAGDGHGHVTYDPWGVSKTATLGDLTRRYVKYG
jgi:hypothetical protein